VTSAFARVSACVALVVTVSVASPAVGAAQQTPFCAAARTLQEEFRAEQGFSIARRAEVRRLRRVVRTAAADAPRALARPFRTLLDFYDRVIDGEIAPGGDDRSEDRYGKASERAGRAGLVVARFLRDRCGILL
jgi:hypothetical protein